MGWTEEYNSLGIKFYRAPASLWFKLVMKTIVYGAPDKEFVEPLKGVK